MTPLAMILLLTSAPAFTLQQSTLDSAQARYSELLTEASREGLTWLVPKLEALANESPLSPATPAILETMEAIALLHPGSVRDETDRFANMIRLAAANPQLDKTVRRIETLRKYFLSLAGDAGEISPVDLSDSSLDGSVLVSLARADQTFRQGNFAEAERLAEQIIETDPFSPLNANAYALMALCRAYAGDATKAARLFQQALSITPFPTLYGRTQDYLTSLLRFTRPAPAPIGGLFEEMNPVKISGAAPLRDPRALLPTGKQFVLADREQVLLLSAEGKVDEARNLRKIEDFSPVGSGRFYYLADDSVDLGAGSPTRIYYAPMGSKAKSMTKLRSLALSSAGDLFVLDQDSGLLVCRPSATPVISASLFAPIRGRLVRIDRRGRIWVLTSDQRSIHVLSRDGKTVLNLAPTVPGGKEASIEYFALDELNHAYILDTASSSIQVFAVNEAGDSLDKKRVAAIPLDQRSYNKNLRVIAVSSTGEVAVTGKNDDYWVLYR